VGDGVSGPSVLAAAALAPATRSLPVVLDNADQASGLADMLHQFLQQTLEDFPEKRAVAGKLVGTLWFQSAEDPTLVVTLTFSSGGIRVADVAAGAIQRPSLTADILSTAHLTTGQVSPFTLLIQKKISASVRVSQALFLLRVLSFMKVDDGGSKVVGQRSRAVLFFVLFMLLVAGSVGMWLAYS